MRSVLLDGERLEKVAAVLAQCPLFAGMAMDQLVVAARAATLAQYDADEPLMMEGEPSDAFHVILAGEASVRIGESGRGESREISRLTAHDCAGELGLILGEPRTATVVALGMLHSVRFSKEVFDQLVLNAPEFGAALLRALSRRVVGSSRMVPMTDSVPRQLPTTEVVSLLPFDFVQRQRVIPLHLQGRVLELGFVDDPNPVVLDAARRQLPSLELRPVRIEATFFDQAMRSYSGASGLWHVSTEPAVAPVPDVPSESPRLDLLLRRMVAEGASDLHLSARQRPRWRVDGEMREVGDLPPLGPREVLELLAPVMGERSKEAFTEDRDADFAYALGDVARFRVNLFCDAKGIGAVLRQIPAKILSFDQLGLPPAVKGFCELPKGLVLVTGPTGSGKSTTLAAMIDAINHTRRAHILTLEDPIEFVHESDKSLVNQREVGSHTNSFARALKAALREDPDIVLIGEMRDLETITLALETANTGHLVFGTLHTATAASTVDRIINVFPPEQHAQVRTTLSEVLKGVVAQTLCKKIGGGRAAALEILVVNSAMQNLIREGKTFQIPGAMTLARSLGNGLLNEELARLVQERKVTAAEAMSKSVDKADLQKRLGVEA